MKLDKAIEILENLVSGAGSWSPVDTVEALKISIEALKRELEYRESMPPLDGELLPGETKE